MGPVWFWQCQEDLGKDLGNASWCLFHPFSKQFPFCGIFGISCCQPFSSCALGPLTPPPRSVSFPYQFGDPLLSGVLCFLGFHDSRAEIPEGSENDLFCNPRPPCKDPPGPVQRSVFEPQFFRPPPPRAIQSGGPKGVPVFLARQQGAKNISLMTRNEGPHPRLDVTNSVCGRLGVFRGGIVWGSGFGHPLSTLLSTF